MDENFRIIRAFDLPHDRLGLVVEFEPFASQWRALGLTDAHLHVLQLMILRDPDAGDVVPGSGGLRKIRFAASGSGRGKSGGFRVYYLNALEYGCLVLWAVLSKSQRADLTKADRNAIAKRAAAIKDYLKNRAEGAIMKGAKKGEGPGAEGDGLSPLGRAMVAGADAFLESVQAGEPIEKRFTVRTVEMGPGPREFKAEDVKAVRGYFGASQAVFADFLGVSVATLQSWEQGARPVPGIASRYLDDLIAFPQLWERRTKKVAAE